MAQIALAQEPFEIAIGGGADVIGFEGRLLFPVACPVGLVALLAMVAIKNASGGDRVGLAGEGVGTGMIFAGNAIPMTGGRGSQGEDGNQS